MQRRLVATFAVALAICSFIAIGWIFRAKDAAPHKTRENTEYLGQAEADSSDDKKSSNTPAEEAPMRTDQLPKNQGSALNVKTAISSLNHSALMLAVKSPSGQDARNLARELSTVCIILNSATGGQIGEEATLELAPVDTPQLLSELRAATNLSAKMCSTMGLSEISSWSAKIAPDPLLRGLSRRGRGDANDPQLQAINTVLSTPAAHPAQVGFWLDLEFGNFVENFGGLPFAHQQIAKALLYQRLTGDVSPESARSVWSCLLAACPSSLQAAIADPKYERIAFVVSSVERAIATQQWQLLVGPRVGK